MKKIILICVIFLLVVKMFAMEVKFSADSRVHPRYDLKRYYDSSGNETTKYGDFYCFYRIRLNMSATIGEGYFLKLQLAHNSPAYLITMANGSSLPHTLSDYSAQAPAVHFTQVYFGKFGDNGWQVGRVPIKGNSMLDIHYYPNIVLDIPFLIFNNNAITGGKFNLKIGSGSLNGFVSIDKNNLNYSQEVEIIIPADTAIQFILNENNGNIIPDTTITPEHTTGGKETNNDGYTFGTFYEMKLGKFTVSPNFLISRNKTTQNPITIGTDLSYELGKYNLFGGFGYTKCDDDDNNYTGYIFRIGLKGKIGPGNLNYYYDIAQIDNEDDNVNDYSYFWLHYAIDIVNTDLGKISIAPTWRRYVKSIDNNKNYSRDMFEIVLNIKLN